MLNISIAHLPVHYYSEPLPTTALILSQISHVEALQATANEGFVKVPTWRLEWDSNLQPSGHKALTTMPHTSLYLLTAADAE